MWAGIFAVLSHFGILTIDWEEVSRWAVMVVIAVFTVGAVWLNVEKDQVYLDELEAQREAEGLELAEEDDLPPRAA
jgi:hypothetical protein